MSGQQGRWYRKQWENQYQKTMPKYIEEGSAPMYEGMDTMKSTNTGNPALDQLLAEFDEKYTQYMSLTSEISKLEEENTQTLLRNNVIPEVIRPYLGKIIQDETETYYYVTRYGHLRQFTQDAWDTRDMTCKNTNIVPDDIPKVESALLPSFLPAPNMNAYEPCGKEGKVVRNGSADEYKWVNPEGQGRIFQTEAEYNANVYCPSEYDTVSTEQYTAIRVVAGDSLMTPDSKCSVLIQDKSLQDNILNKKQQLIDVIHQMMSLLHQIESTDEELTKEVKEHQASLSLAISNLTQEIKNQKEIKEDNDTLRGRWQDIIVQERMEYYQYVGVATVGALIAGVMLHQLFRK